MVLVVERPLVLPPKPRLEGMVVKRPLLPSKVLVVVEALVSHVVLLQLGLLVRQKLSMATLLCNGRKLNH